MKNVINLSALLLLFVSVLGISACKDDTVPNEEELITTLQHTLTPAGGGSPVVFLFRDTDGDGGNAPVIQGGNLRANTSYTAEVTLLDESKNPAENITEEIEAEKETHQFFFSTTVAGMTIAYTDQDAGGNPVGLKTTVATGAAGTGNLTVILRHEPNKSAAGVRQGDVTNAGGETDIEVVFPVTVQ